jgi:uncharacterized protein YndB with AHSA1/START domain
MAETQKVIVERYFSTPPSRLYQYLAEHENLEDLFSSKIQRLTDGSDGLRNGVGSSRQLKIGFLPPFVETTTEVIPDRLIRWRITKGSPLRNHEGAMRFAPDGAGTQLRIEITFNGAFPGVAPFAAAMMRRGIPRGLATLEPVLSA